MADFQTISDIIGLPDHMKILLLDPGKPQVAEESYTVLVNPASYTVNYGALYSSDKAIGTTKTHYTFNRTVAQTMDLELLFDSTGSLGKIPLIGNQSVLKQIEQFLLLAYAGFQKEEEEDPEKLLKLVWGPMEFVGYLTRVDITYSHFDPSGTPVRATASCTFEGGDVKFEKPEEIKNPFRKKDKPRKKVDFAKQKHAINAILKYGSYVAIVSQQPKSAMPKSLRIAEQIAKMIIR